MIALPQPRALRYRIADLSLDIGRRELSRENTPIPLGKLSFDMFRVLVEEAPDIVTKERLAAHVWNGRIITPETLAQRVKLLRHALSDDARSPTYIGVVRGHGYRVMPKVEFLQHCAPRYTLAVLPLEPLTLGQGDRAFAAGLHEELLMRLADLSTLDVLARTSVKRFAGTSQMIPGIASTLSVELIMEGTVRRARNRIRTTLRLIDGRSGTRLWADIYDCAVGDPFDIQSRVANEFVKKLGLETTGRSLIQ